MHLLRKSKENNQGALCFNGAEKTLRRRSEGVGLRKVQLYLSSKHFQQHGVD
jgi:hypothetical protein